jgi:hypothetical protein
VVGQDELTEVLHNARSAGGVDQHGTMTASDREGRREERGT